MIQVCTLTGIDESVPFCELKDLSFRYGFAEWGVLYSEARSRDPAQWRYPSEEWIAELIQRMEGRLKRASFAMHVCGSAVEQFCRNEGWVSEAAKSFKRVQLNFSATNIDVALVRRAIEDRPQQTIITQHNLANENVWKEMAGLANHAVLFDTSLGTGRETKAWLPVLPDRKCGYAGGIGPSNIVRQIDAIESASAGKAQWIDMEGRLREQDRFCLRAANFCLEVFAIHETPGWF